MEEDEVKKKIAEHYGCSEEEVYIGNIYYIGNGEKNKLQYKIIYGNVYIGDNIETDNPDEIIDLSLVKVIFGSLLCTDNELTIDLSGLEEIKDNVKITYNDNINLSSLKIIDGNFTYKNYEHNDELDLSSLKTITGDLETDDFINLSGLETVGGKTKFTSKEAIKANNLKSVNGKEIE